MHLDCLEPRLAPSITLVPTSLPDWTVNDAGYNQVINASGGTAPTFAVTGGTLPPGLTLSTSGVLSGTPTSSGTYNFTVTATLLAPTFTTTLDDPSASPSTYATGVSGGSIVGFYAANNVSHGFLYDGSTYTTLDDPSATPGKTRAYGISGSNIVGWYQNSSGTHGFLYNGSTYTTLDDPSATPGSTAASGIDGSNIVGYYYNSTGDHGFLYDGSTYTTLDDPSATPGQTFAFGISGSNIVGIYQDSVGTHGFVYNGSSYTRLDDPSASATGGTYPFGISGSNIVGYYHNISSGFHGFLYNGSTYTSLDDPRATPGTTEAYGISGSNIVGWYGNSTGAHGFVAALSAASGSQSYSVTINPPPSITTTTLPNWTMNVANYDQAINATGGTGSLTFTSTGMVPPGLALSTSGVLSGTPTSAGSYNFTVTATDSLLVVPSYTTLDDPSASPGSTIAQGISGSNIVGWYYSTGWNGFLYNDSAYTTLDDPNASPGQTFAEGISGSNIVGYFGNSSGDHGFLYNGSTYTTLDDPNATPGNTFAEGISGSNIVGYFGNSSGTHGFLYNGSTYTTLDDPSATPGNTYAFGISGSNIVGYYKNSSGAHGFLYNDSTYTTLDDPNTTPGNTFAQGISGSNIVGQFSDSIGAHGFLATLSGASGSRSYTVTINPPLSITPTTLPNWTLNQPGYNTTISAADGTAPVSLGTTAGTLPPGLTLSSNGVLSGTPTVAGTYSFTVMANDAGGAKASQSFSITIGYRYLVTVPGSTTAQAGSGFLVTVQAADAYGIPITNYSGPSSVNLTLSPNPAGSSLPSTLSLNQFGLGFFLASIPNVGTYTITAASGSFTGTSSTITVGPGPASKLGFGVQPVNTPTGVTLPAVTVQVLDAYGNVVTSDNTDTVILGISSGPGTFTGGSTTSATVHNGVAMFSNLTLVKPGSYTLSEIVTGLYTGPSSNALTIAPLQVLPGSFAGTATGFSLQLNAPFLVDSVTPALYGSGFGVGATVAPTVTLTQTTGTPPTGAVLPYQVPSSLIVNAASNTLTFAETDTSSMVGNGTPLLPDGTYVVHISSSGANGLQALNSGGGYLDGTDVGTPGHDFTATFTVGARAAGDDVLWVPATADGPGQALSAPGKNQVGGGYPVYLDDSSGTVTDVQATLSYNPSFLTVTPSSTSTFTITVPTAGTAMLHYSGPPLAAGTQTPIGFITAMVPAGTMANPTPYKAKDLLELSEVSVNGGATPSVGSDALHLVAYVGDADGNGTYSSNDAVLITRVALQTDSGFVAYPLVDPVIVADTDGSGFIPADAALQANEAGAGLPTANLPIPPIPPGVVFQPIANNVDPSISIPSNLQVGANGTVVPVHIDDAHPAGSTGLIEAHLALTFDPRQFTVAAANVHPGSLLAGGDWSIVTTIDQATGQIGIALSSTTPIASTIGGSLVTIDFHPTGTISGAAPFELVASADPNGQYVATELEDAQGTFTLSPAPTNGFDPRIDGVVVLPAPPAAPAISMPGAEATTIVSAAPNDAQLSDSRYAQDATMVEPANSSADAAPIEGSERDTPSVSTIPAVNVSAAVHVAAVAASSSLASVPAAGLLGALIGQVGGASIGSQISRSQPLGDQFFQALGRWMSGPADTVVANTMSDSFARVLAGQLLPVPPTPDALDNLNWDEVSRDVDWQNAGDFLTSRGPDDAPANRPFVPTTTSLAVADQATLDQCFSQTDATLDQLKEDE